MVLRTATAQDVPDICRVVDAAYSVQVRRLYGNTARGQWPHYPESRVDAYRQREAAGVRVGEIDGRVVACCVSRSYGSLGWFHSLAVHPDFQQRGLGKAIVQDAEAYLRGRGVGVIGLMTWPDAMYNIGFYQGLGYRFADATCFAYRHSQAALITGEPTLQAARLSGFAADEQDAAIAEAAKLTSFLLPGLDYGPWLKWALQTHIGDALLLWQDGRLCAFVLAYSALQNEWLEGKLFVAHPELADSDLLWALEFTRRWAQQLSRGSFGIPLDLADARFSTLLRQNNFLLLGDAMINLIQGEPWPARGPHHMRFSG